MEHFSSFRKIAQKDTGKLLVRWLLVLLAWTQSQVIAKESGVKAYVDKVTALDNQITALRENLELNFRQAQNKVKQVHLKLISDSIDFKAAQTNYNIADKQFKRQKELYKQGLVSLTNLELRELKFQESIAKLISAENKVLISQNLECLFHRIKMM